MQNYQENQIENLPEPSFNREIAEKMPPSPNNPPWTTPVALGTWLVSVILLVLFSAVFGLGYLAAQKVNFQDAEAVQQILTTDPTAILVQIASVIPAHLLTLLIAWSVITKFNKYSFKEMVGWKWGGFNWLHIIGIVIGFHLLAAALTLVFGEQTHDLTKMLKTSRNAVFFVAFMATFTAPIVEEAIYRGILYSAFQRSFGVTLAVVAVTALFAGVHFVQYWNSPVALFLVTLLSLVLTLIRVKSGSLLPCIVLHTIFNGVQSILLILEPYISKPATQETVTQSFIHFVK